MQTYYISEVFYIVEPPRIMQSGQIREQTKPITTNHKQTK